MRDEVYEVLREFDNDGRFYADIYPLANAEDGTEILVFDDWDSVRKMQSALLKICGEEEDFPGVNECSEYDTSAIDYMCEGDDFWTFTDEGFRCDECGKWHFYHEYNACSYTNYQIYDGYIICEDCIKASEDQMEEYLKDKINDPEKANVILNNEELSQLNFERVNDWAYANGWYGSHDDPKKILKKVKELYGKEHEYLFSIRKTYNPFETEFDLYKREVA